MTLNKLRDFSNRQEGRTLANTVEGWAGREIKTVINKRESLWRKVTILQKLREKLISYFRKL